MGSMRVALEALRELRGAEFLHGRSARQEPMNEVEGLLSGALFGSVLWIVLLRLTWFS